MFATPPREWVYPAALMHSGRCRGAAWGDARKLGSVCRGPAGVLRAVQGLNTS